MLLEVYTKELYSNEDSMSEGYYCTIALTSFNSDGFTVGSYGGS
jgi:hypothetical protein